MTSRKANQYLVVTLKVAIVIAALLFIYFRVTGNTEFNLSQFKATIQSLQFSNIGLLFIIPVLTILNWGFEILKWQKLSGVIEKFHLTESSKQVFTAQAVSLFTPFKIGEYGAKTVFFAKKEAKKVIFLNFCGNMSQLAATLFFGCIGIGVYISIHFPDYFLLYILSIILLLVFAIGGNKAWKNVHFSLSGFTLEKIRKFSGKIPTKTKQAVMGFAFLRYVFFSLQFSFILHLFLPVSIMEVLPLVFIMYIISSAVPVLQLFDLVIKGSVAVLVFSGYNELAILSTTFLMWLLNAVVPAIIGSYYVLAFNTNTLLKPLPQ